LPPYVANEKQQFSFLMSEDFQERVNIAWRVEEAEKDPKNPLIEPKHKWDSGCVFLHGSVLIDPADNLWKAWYLSNPQGKGSKDASVDVEQVGSGNRTVFFQVRNLRQVDGVHQHEAGQRSGDDSESQEREKGNAARQLHRHRRGRARRTKAISARRWSLHGQ